MAQVPAAAAARATAAAALLLATLLAGTTAPSALFVIYRASMHMSPAAIGIVFATYVVTLLPVLLVFGGLADRFGRRIVIAVGLLCALAGLVVLALAHDVPVLAVARLLQGVGVGLASGALTAAISETHRGRLPAGTITVVASATGLLTGAVITAGAYDASRSTALAVVPLIVVTIAMFVAVMLLPARGESGAPDGAPYDRATVVRALVFALPITFVGWSGVSLFLAMVPAFIASALGAADPFVGAAVIAAVQIFSITGTFAVRRVAVEAAGVGGPIAVVAGLVALVAGTMIAGTAGWLLIGLATVLVGAGGGAAFAAGVAATMRVCRGQRARLFARLYVAAYLGFAVPSWVVGAVAVRSSFAIGFVVVIATLAAIVVALPYLGKRAALHAVPA